MAGDLRNRRPMHPHQIGMYEMTEPSLPISFTCTRRPRSSYQTSCEYRPLIS